MDRDFDRRKFLASVAATTTLTIPASAGPDGKPSQPKKSPALERAILFGDRFMSWQSPYGGPDLTCPYRTPGPFNAFHLHGCGPMTRALYRLFDATGNPAYKAAADRYALFLLNMIHDPPTPYGSMLATGAKKQVSLSSAWMYGKALSPCYEWFCTHNPREDALERKAYVIYKWLQQHRREDSYFGVGYRADKAPDAQFSCDLGEVGGGLVGFYQVSKHPPVLQDALGLARFFLTDYQPGSGRGVWSPQLGVWLVGPWPSSGEHQTDQAFNRTGWGWSAYIDSEFLLRLRELISDDKLKAEIADKCTRALQWCVDACQFDDGAHGMFGRDDKWVGMGAAAILLYAALDRGKAIAPDVDKQYRPRMVKAWRWLLDHTGRDTFPEDGYIRVTGRTSKKPLENLVWMMAWTCEALLTGESLFGAN